MRIEQWQIDMARRVPPDVGSFVSGSTPVISFGDVLVAEVATIGINPSRREFDDGGWLRGDKRRLATLESLDAAPGRRLSEDQARHVVADCNDYFHRHPYWRWFKPLDELLTVATGTGYLGGACHLDLVQWATDPVWGKLTNPAEKQLLLDEGRPHLATLLRESNVNLVLAAGRAVVRQLERIGVVHWEIVSTIPMAHTTCTLLKGAGDGVSFIGWSSNIQTQAGATSKDFRRRLADEVRQLIEPVLTAATEPAAQREVMTMDVELDGDGYLSPVVQVKGKREFAGTLRRWYEGSQAKTIGDIGSFGGRPGIAVDLGEHAVVLNVDTKRAAVAAYLAYVREHGPDTSWRVIANTRGTVNKVIFSDDPADAAGWYLYLRKPLPTPGEI